MRNRLIRSEFDGLILKHPGVYAGNQLARKYQMTERNVWMLLKKADITFSGAQYLLF